MIRRPPSSTLFPYPTLSRSGFDPLRQALYDHHRRGPADVDPMAVVRRAIEVHQIVVGDSTKTTGGLVGVKLYPPMGFRATDNRHLPDVSFNEPAYLPSPDTGLDRKSTRLNSSHSQISYAVFCLKKKT